MFDLLLPMPDPATQDAMIRWAVGGAVLGFGSILVQWFVKRVLRRAPADLALHIPGAPQVSDPTPAPWSPAGLWAAIVLAVIGAMGAWGWYGSELAQQRLGLILATVGVLQAVWQLLHVVRDIPAVGEPPPDDPDKTVAARMPAAWGGIAMACFGALVALF